MILRLDCESFQLNPLVTTGRLRIVRRIVINRIRPYKQIVLKFKITYSLFHNYQDLSMTNLLFETRAIKATIFCLDGVNIARSYLSHDQ